MNRQAVPVSGTGHALVDLAGAARVKAHGEVLFSFGFSFSFHLCFHFIVLLLVFLHFGALESKNEKTRGTFHFIFISVFILFSFSWFSCISGPWKAKMKNTRGPFHFIFISVFMLFSFCWFSCISGPWKAKMKNTRGTVHCIFICVFILFSFCWFSCISGPWKAKKKKLEEPFIVFSFVFSFHCLFAGFPAFRDPGKQK